MSNMSYEIVEDGNTYTLRMIGEITAQTLPQYRKIFDDLMVELDVVNKTDLTFIVDYGGITAVDSSALANILDRLKHDVRSDHKVVFINVPDKFKSIVELHKMEDKIKIYESEEEAKEAMKKWSRSNSIHY